MKTKIRKYLTMIIVLALGLIFGQILLIYTKPMKDITLDLSLQLADGESPDPNYFEMKGWTVYTHDGQQMTILEPDGYGGFEGLELGQTFYFSRVMEEELDSPTLQLPDGERNFSIWLDDKLIYTDCPELDNRIGHLTLPMREWYKSDPLTLSLAQDYPGKTLTIAQSFPNYTETGSVKAYPAEVKLYCGYAYESKLIAESFGTAIYTTLLFIIGIVLLFAALRHHNANLLCIAMVALLSMTVKLIDTSFFYRYFGTYHNSVLMILPKITVGVLFIFLATQAGKYKPVLWSIITVYLLSLLVHGGFLLATSNFNANDRLASIINGLPDWFSFAGYLAIFILGTVFWRQENRFYRLFSPIVLLTTALYWIAVILFIDKDQTWLQITLNLESGQITYIVHKFQAPVIISALLSSIVLTIRSELDRRTERQLLEERHQLALAGYENMRRQHEEVMILRHDMNRHFQLLQKISREEQVISYLDELIGQQQTIRPVVQSGNEMLDIILGSKINSAVDAGIKVEILRAEAPGQLPLSDADLCSLMMNIMDNALTAAAAADTVNPYIRLNIHKKDNFLSILCENSASAKATEFEAKKETVQKHGLGLKIIRHITARYEGMIDVEHESDSYKIRIAIPLD